MRFAVSQAALLEGLQATQNVVSNRMTLPVLSNVLVETVESGLRLTTTDMDVSIRRFVPALVERGGSTTLPVKRLLAITRELPPGEIQVETDSKHVSSIRCGASFFKIFGLPKEEFPVFPTFENPKTFVLPQKSIQDGLRKTSYAISLDETRYVLNGILFSFLENKLTLVATDGRRLALWETEIEFPKSQERDFIVPTKAVHELERLVSGDADLTISVGENLASFELEGCLLVTKLVEGVYPNYRQVIPSESKERITIERETFLKCVHRVSLLSQDKANSVKLTLAKNNLDISSTAPEIGEARESLAIAYKGKDFSISFNPEFLMAPLRNLPDDEVHMELTDGMSQAVIKIKTPFLYVLMPMRVSS